MTTIRQRHVHMFVSRKTPADERCDAATLLAAGDELAKAAEAVLARSPSLREWQLAMDRAAVAVVDALAKWNEVTG